MSKMLQVTLNLYEADMIHLALVAYKKLDQDPDLSVLVDQWATMVNNFAIHTCQETKYEASSIIKKKKQKNLQKKYKSSQSERA